MAWLDDRLWCHPKLVNVSDRAFRVYVNGIAYSSGMGTSGVLTASMQKLVGSNEKTRQELTEKRLWDAAGENVVIHDWDLHNSKRDARRRADRERKREERERRREEKSTGTSAGRSAGPAHVEGSEGSEGSEKRESYDSLTRTIWDTFADELGKAETKSERGRRNKAIKELLEVGATPEEVRKRCRAYRRLWPEVALTATGLAANWSFFAGVTPTLQPVEEVIDLPPELTEEERAANIARVRDMKQAIVKEIA